MKQRLQVLAIATLTAILVGLSNLSFAQSENPQVTIDSGILAGVRSGGVVSFKGIPFVAPPVGDFRWRSPQPIEPWDGIRPATEYGQDCIQKPLPGDAAASGSTFGEDCLVLNVWRPEAIAPDEKLPVMVWIHGGGFLNGGSSAAIFDGEAFASQGMVLVSFNYRLGRLGFFAHPALTAAKEGPLGNYGLMDQLAALQWVQRNIAAFGGDPNRVTLVGESAGGISVMHHLISPESRGLFQQAVVLSGGGRTFLMGLRNLQAGTPELPSAEESGIEFAKTAGITGDGTETLAALRALPADQVNGDLSMEALVTKPPTYAGGPIFDGAIIRALPQEVLQKGEAANVPLIIGTTTADLPVTFPPLDNPFSYFGADAERAIATYNPDGTLPPQVVIPTIAVDITMHEPARFVARQMAAHGNPAWLYRFGYVAESLRPETMGASHSSELPFMFNTLEARYGKAATAQDQQAANLFHTSIANFVKTGNPNSEDLPNWPQHDSTRSDLIMFNLDATATLEADPWAERLDLVERAANAHTNP